MRSRLRLFASMAIVIAGVLYFVRLVLIVPLNLAFLFAVLGVVSVLADGNSGILLIALPAVLFIGLLVWMVEMILKAMFFLH
jgi:predicted ABC-type sugar transport system permease subunit